MDAVNTDDGEDYCRAIEAYLCRKNDGHLIRIVGPAFDQVRGWSSQGVPLTIAYLGIDRYVERYYAKAQRHAMGQRRRPVRVEFCEADILDAFDDWRRAVGVPAPIDPSSGNAALLDGTEDAATPEGSGVPGSAALGSAAPGSPAPRRAGSLASHLERVTARLTALQSSTSPEMAAVVDPVIHELDTARHAAARLRGEAREALMARLRELDAHVLRQARAHCTAGTIAELTAQTETELAPFRTRLSPSEYAAACDRGVDRLVRQRWALPTLTVD